jgi:hypothetical protein
MITQLESQHYSECEHGEIEQYITKEGDEILRRLFQGYLDLKASNESRLPFITSAAGEKLNHVKAQTTQNRILYLKGTFTRISYCQASNPECSTGRCPGF